MNNFLPILYSGFWDVPRIFLVEYSNSILLFDCKFEEIIDDYPSEYKVYLIPEHCQNDLKIAWDYFLNNSPDSIGEVVVAEVEFDETKRKFINDKVLKNLFIK